MAKIRAVPDGPRGIVRWEEPPPSAGRRRRSRFDAATADLRRNPGKWAVVAIYPEGQRATGAINHFRHKLAGFEATERMQADGRSFVYARFVGVDGDHDDRE